MVFISSRLQDLGAGSAKHWLEERNCLQCWLMSLEAAGQLGNAPETPWSYSNNEINPECFSFFSLCQDTHAQDTSSV